MSAFVRTLRRVKPEASHLELLAARVARNRERVAKPGLAFADIDLVKRAKLVASNLVVANPFPCRKSKHVAIKKRSCRALRG